MSQLSKIESPLTMSAERGLAIYDKSFLFYNDARQHLRDDLASASSSQGGGGSESTGRLAEIKLADRALAVLLSEENDRAKQISRRVGHCEAHRRDQSRER